MGKVLGKSGPFYFTRMEVDQDDEETGKKRKCKRRGGDRLI